MTQTTDQVLVPETDIETEEPGRNALVIKGELPAEELKKLQIPMDEEYEDTAQKAIRERVERALDVRGDQSAAESGNG